MRFTVLTKEMGWYGSRSGYYSQLPARWTGARVVAARRTFWRRAAGKLIAAAGGLPVRDQSLTFAEWWFRKTCRGPGAILAVEDHLPMLERWEGRLPTRIVPTIHFPWELWDGRMQAVLAKASGAVVLYTRDLERFEGVIGTGRVRYVPHGVDTEFFSPPDEPREDRPPEAVFVGQFYRNFAMASRVVIRLAAAFPGSVYHFVVPERYPGEAREREYFAPIARHPSVRWHSGLSEEGLLALYRRCSVMLLPMDASGANNAVVEALACGLPVATTDVGGIRDYGGGSVFPVVANNDDDAMVGLVGRYFGDDSWRESVARACRAFAVRELGWDSIAARHLEVYRELGDAPR